MSEQSVSIARLLRELNEARDEIIALNYVIQELGRKNLALQRTIDSMEIQQAMKE